MEAPGNQETGLLLFFLGYKSMACFLIAGSLGTDSQPHILLLAVFMSHRCATECQCQLAILLGADALTFPYEDQAHLPSSIPCPLGRWEDERAQNLTHASEMLSASLKDQGEQTGSRGPELVQELALLQSPRTQPWISDGWSLTILQGWVAKAIFDLCGYYAKSKNVTHGV